MTGVRRYLVPRKLVIHEDDEGEVATHQPGDELALVDDISEAVQKREPGALTRTRPKTKTDRDG